MLASDIPPLARELAQGDTDSMSSAKVKRVLLYRLGSLGDHLVALPSYRLVRRAFPEAECRLVTSLPVSRKAPAAEAVLAGTGLVEGYMAHASGERNPWVLLRLAWQILRWRPDVLVYLAGARGESIAVRDNIFFRMCGIRRRIGIPLTAELQRNRIAEPPSWALSGTPWFEEEGQRLARSIAEIGDAALDDPESWAPGLSADERAEGATLLEPLGGAPFFAFSLGTKVQANQWGVDRWQDLMARVAAEWPGYGLAIVGAEDEFAMSEAVAATWRAVPGAGPALNYCGAATPRVSAAILEHAVMFLGHDSGPAHMAASVGTPVLGVFSARVPPGVWVPHGKHVRVVLHWVDCGGCVLDTCIVQGKKCILSIGVDEVMTAFRAHAASVGLTR